MMTEPANPMDDQLEAATAEAESVFTTYGAMRSLDVGSVGPVTVRIVREYREALEAPDGRMCVHVADSPQVIYGAACVPGVAGCAPCAQQLLEAQLVRDHADGRGRTCDGCKEKATQGYCGILQFGPVLLVVSICESCERMDET